MTAPLDEFNTKVQLVRGLIPDVEPLQNPNDPNADPEFMFTDGHLLAFLSLNAGNVKRAAASACAVVGRSEAIVSKVIATQDLKTDGASVMRQFLAAAAALRQEAKDDEALDPDGSDGLGIIPFYLLPTHYEPIR